MYADMMRQMQQKDIDKKKKESKAAIVAAADSEVYLAIIYLTNFAVRIISIKRIFKVATRYILIEPLLFQI